jgi:hypothetical protein
MRQRRACLVLLVGIAAGCAGIQAQSDYDPNARFDTYKTFFWIGEQPGTLPSSSQPSQPGLDPLLARRIQSSIESHLEAKGYKKVDDVAKADFGVSFNVALREKIRVQSSPGYYGGGYWGYGGWYTSSVWGQSYTEGTLAIDIFDARSHLAVWHGWASKPVEESGDRAAAVDEAVGAILAKFPPPR